MNRLIETLKKYSIYIHLTVLVAVYAVYYALFNVETVHSFKYFNGFVYCSGFFYWAASLFSLKNFIFEKDGKLLGRIVLYFLMGVFLFSVSNL